MADRLAAVLRFPRHLATQLRQQGRPFYRRGDQLLVIVELGVPSDEVPEAVDFDGRCGVRFFQSLAEARGWASES